MTRLNMAILKIPFTTNSISSEIIDYFNSSDGRKPLMGGNWKLNPRTVKAATDLATDVISTFIIILFHFKMYLFAVG